MVPNPSLLVFKVFPGHLFARHPISNRHSFLLLVHHPLLIIIMLWVFPFLCLPAIPSLTTALSFVAYEGRPEKIIRVRMSWFLTLHFLSFRSSRLLLSVHHPILDRRPLLLIIMWVLHVSCVPAIPSLTTTLSFVDSDGKT